MVTSAKALDEARHIAAVQVTAASKSWRDLFHRIDGVIKASGFRPPSPRVPFTTRATDAAVKEAESAFSAAVAGDGNYDRAMHLSRVTRAMVAIETVKINRDPKIWLSRHFQDLQPRRSPRSDRVSA
jgi:hypothetical protein